MNVLSHCLRNVSKSSGDAVAVGALAGGKEAGKRSLNVAGRPGDGIGLGETNGTADAPESNTVPPGVSPMRPRRRAGLLSSIVSGETEPLDGRDDVVALGANRPPLPNGPNALAPIGEGSKRL